MDVAITTSGRPPTMVCAHQITDSMYNAVEIRTNTNTMIVSALEVSCVNLALSTEAQTGSFVEISLTTNTVTTTTASMVTNLIKTREKPVQ